MTEILLKVVLNNITPTNQPSGTLIVKRLESESEKTKSLSKITIMFVMKLIHFHYIAALIKLKYYVALSYFRFGMDMMASGRMAAF